MISYIKGFLTEITAQSAIVETAGGVAYEIGMTNYDLETLAVGEEIKVHTYLQVKEDGVALFGFLQKKDLKLFGLLISISGVGPKSGLAVLSAVGGDELKMAIVTEDVKRISGAPGVGKKTAERIVMELKDKISADDILTEIAENAPATDKQPASATEKKMRESVIQVLTALGYSQKEALTAVRSVTYSEEMTEDEMTRLSLRALN